MRIRVAIEPTDFRRGTAVCPRVSKSARDVNLIDHLTPVQRLKETLIPHIREIRELPNGYAFLISEYPTPILTMIDLLSLEEVSHRFSSIRLEVTETDGAVWVHLTGSDGVKEFLKDELVQK